MSEQQIKHGYEELGSELVPPGDALEQGQEIIVQSD